MVSRRQVLHALPALAAVGMPSLARAQSRYPERLVRIIVGNAPGGTDDVISRLLAKALAAELGQSVIVENRGGGSTTIAGAHVAQSPPDGHTILCLINTGIVQPVLREKLGYRLNSFAPIIGVGGFPLCLAVSTVSKITSIDELKALAASPQGIKYSSGGVGTMAHLNSVRFLKAIRGTGLNIPYRNNPEGLSGLMSGDTQMMFASESEIAALRPGGRLRALAVTSSKRAASMPDVPTTAELGFPTIDTTLWHGFVAPAGTPPAIVARLAELIAKGVKDPEFRNALKPLGFVEDIKTGEPLNAFINSEAARWREVIVENNIKVDD
jgi:tripartite-type tricarboxylate transporter receptor subunit TctC